jgi:hypothetical protein
MPCAEFVELRHHQSHWSLQAQSSDGETDRETERGINGSFLVPQRRICSNCSIRVEQIAHI